MKHSILVVDDNAGVTTPMKEYLELGGFEVLIANNSADAREALENKRFSLVITDLRMETGRDDDGLDLIRYMHDVRPGLPVFVLTASGSPEAATEGVRLQVNKFMGKPVSLPGLLSTVRTFLEDLYHPPTQRIA